MKRNEITEVFLIDKWLGDYHNTSMAQVLEEHPDWAVDPQKHTRDFYNTYKVTKEQDEEWRQWVIDTCSKAFRMSKTRTKKDLWAVWLNCSPSVIQEP